MHSVIEKDKYPGQDLLTLQPQGSICETQKGPNRPLIRRGIDYLVYARVLEIQSFWTFWPNLANTFKSHIYRPRPLI